MRASGILLPIFSLPSRYGAGDLDSEAYNFIDRLHEAGQRYWQVLPIGPVTKNTVRINPDPALPVSRC